MKTKALLAAAAFAFVFSSCDKSDDLAGTFKSTQANFGNGKLYSWATRDNNGNPVAVGFTLTAGALDNLGTADEEWTIPFPVSGAKSGYDHVAVGWNPHGHEPAGVYTVPHFDFHFYSITEAAQDAIPPYEQDSVKFNNVPSAEYFPANYFGIPGGVPQMGKHWIDVTSPEFHGQPFTETFIYGSFDGKVIFHESMVAKSYLDTLTSFTKAIPQPAKVKNSGYYPTKYSIKKTNGEYVVSFTDFVYKQGQ